MLVGIVLMLAASIYVTPRYEPVGQGIEYAALSERPFEFAEPNRVRFRILCPLLGHVLFLRGSSYVLVPLAFAALFLSAVYVRFRMRGWRPFESAGVAALMAFASPTLFNFHFQGYPDPATYFFLFLAAELSHRPCACSAAYALALLSHENALFAAPWLLLLSLRNPEGRRKALAAVMLLAALLPLLLYRAYVGAQTTVTYDWAFYLNAERVRSITQVVSRHVCLGVFQAFKLFWAFLAVGLAISVRERKRFDAIFMVLVFVCALAQLLVAADTSRLLGLAFPGILLGAALLRNRIGSDRFTRWVWIVIGLNLLVPQCYVGGTTAVLLVPLPISLLLELLG